MTDSAEEPDDTYFDVVVLGAGPAGSSAAIEAERHGLSVLLVDDAVAAGGQVWRAASTNTSKRLSQGDPDRKAGDSLRSSLAASGVRVLESTVVWSVDVKDGAEYRFRIELHRASQLMTVRAIRLVAALGAVERVVPFPGWTLPGVFGLAAATAMLKHDGYLPGHQIAVAGQGPLLVAVAAKSLAAGLKPTVIIDTARRRDWLQASIGFATSISQLICGVRWMGKLLCARVSRVTQSAVIAAYGEQQLEAIEIAPLSSTGEPLMDQRYRLSVDTLYIGNGLSPVAEVPRLLGAAIRHDTLRGGFSVVHDAFGRTSIPGLLVAGDGAGIRGAMPSLFAGTLAGLACAQDAAQRPGKVIDQRGQWLRQRYRQTESCSDASCRLMLVPAARMAAIPDDVIICRCERVSRAAINAAARQGVRRIDELKTQTRLGMGPCQGRMCAINAAALLAIATGEKITADLLTQRTPLRPLPVDQLNGSFTYDDIPVPAPAPL
ncbi:MAG: FAD-dependent oxidoreductase [Granulosicoccus sp.]